MWEDLSRKMKILLSLAVAYTTMFVAILLGFGVSEISSVETRVVAPQVAGASIETMNKLNENEVLILEEVNRVRSEAGLAALSTKANVQITAQTRLFDMLDRQYFAHKSIDGSTYVDLMNPKPAFSCENLNLTFRTDEAKIVNDWLISNKGHRECLLSNKVKYAGIGFDEFGESVNQENETVNTYATVLILSSD